MSKKEKILIISDTHRNHRLLGAVLQQNKDCQYLIHLGDEPDDLDSHIDLTLNKQIYSIWGIYSQKWSPETATLSFSINELHFHIAHTQDHLKPQKKKTIHCFGHTHHRFFQKTAKGIFINPGHLKEDIDRHEIAGYAVIETGKKPVVKFYDFKHNLLSENVI